MTAPAAAAAEGQPESRAQAIAASPEEGAVSRGTFREAVVVLIVALLIVAVLRAKRAYPTGFWETDSGIFGLAFDAQLVLLAAGVVALRFVPPRFARHVILAEGLGCIAAYGLRGAVYLAGLAAWFLALEVPITRRLRPLLPLCLIIGAGILGATDTVKGLLTFSILFTPRLMMYAWDKWQKDWPRGRWQDFALYFLSPPLAVFPPYVAIIPYYGNHAQRFTPQLTARRAARALIAFRDGLRAIVALFAVSWAVSELPPPRYVLSIYVHYVFVVLQVGVLAYFVFGLLLLHGFGDERPPLDKPLLATSYVDLWTRFQTHQKDQQVSFFYAPVLFRLRRANRYVAIVAATAVTMLLGNTLVHVLVRYIYSPAKWLPKMVGNYEFFVLSTVVLSASLCFQEWQRRAKWHPPGGLAGTLYTAAAWFLTFTFTAFLMSL